MIYRPVHLLVTRLRLEKLLHAQSSYAYTYTFADILSASYRIFRGDLWHVNVRVWVFCYDDPCTELSHSSTRCCTAEPQGGSAFHSSGPSIVLSLPYGLTATWHLRYSWLRLRYSWLRLRYFHLRTCTHRLMFDIPKSLYVFRLMPHYVCLMLHRLSRHFRYLHLRTP